MNYITAKTNLYNSVEIQNIPDKWQESIPFLCYINGVPADAFLYWNTGKETEIKRMIYVSRKDGCVQAIQNNELLDIFGLTSVKCKNCTVSNYDLLFSQIKRYEKLYAELYDELTCGFIKNKSAGKECYELMKDIFGVPMFEQIIKLIAKEYIRLLNKNI